MKHHHLSIRDQPKIVKTRSNKNMKTVIYFLLLVATVMAQDLNSVTYIEEWAENNRTLAGARGVAVHGGLVGNGTCSIAFPSPVFWFHCEDCDIVPLKSSSAEGRYTLSASNKFWQGTSDRFTFVINYLGNPFNETTIIFDCDTTDENEVSLLSFPSNMVQSEARSRIYELGLSSGDHYLINFPAPVANFTVDHPNTVDGEGDLFMIENIQPWQKEIWFQFRYTDVWFSAAEVDVVRGEAGTLDEETKRRRRNAHF